MNRRVLSPAGHRKLRIGRKVIATSKMAASLERRGVTVAMQPKKRKLAVLHYQFRRWHAFTALGVVVLIVISAFAINMIRAQQIAAEKEAAIKAQASARAASQANRRVLRRLPSKRKTN